MNFIAALMIVRGLALTPEVAAPNGARAGPPGIRIELPRGAAFATAFAAALAAAASQPRPGGVEQKRAATGSPPISAFPAEFLRNFGRLWSGDNSTPLVAGIAATGMAAVTDGPATDYFDFERRLKQAGDIGDLFGRKGLVVGAAGALLALAYTRDDDGFRELAFFLGQGVAVNSTLTGALKVAVGRERPNGEDQRSFPSGHTSNAFTWATILSRHYGGRTAWVAYPAAALIGISRLEKQKHHPSDVAAGAALGIIVGRTVGRGTEAASPGREISFRPALSRDAVGVGVSVRF